MKKLEILFHPTGVELPEYRNSMKLAEVGESIYFTCIFSQQNIQLITVCWHKRNSTFGLKSNILKLRGLIFE